MSRFPRLVRLLLLALASVLLIAAKQRAVQPSVRPAPPRDVFSFSEPSKVVVRHVAFDLTIDFTADQLAGSETLDVDNFTGTNKLVLDTDSLDIHSVTIDGHVPTTFSVGTATGNGAPLTIDVRPSTQSVTIDYTTTTRSGVRWTNATPTPTFVYSNAEPIGTRSWLPIQDTPAVRVTYDATLRVPGGTLALMTAENNATAANDSGIYSFHQGTSLPAYLIAFAAGNLVYHAFDSRTGVYADRGVIGTAATKLDYIPSVLSAAESLLGPYPWTRYDIILMPQGYPGGMENPNLNFIAPRVLLQLPPSPLITHELSHSWTGDMVTLADWPDTWINEGFASYYELRLQEPFVGKSAVDPMWTA